MGHQPKKVGILVGGGPAPGINAVIGAATIRSMLSGYDVVGILDGFNWIMKGDIDHVRHLATSDVSRIHFRGGSHLGISRANPTKGEHLLENTIVNLLRLDVDKLITIGGDDTAFSASQIERQSKGPARVLHVPKTIDNDLDLPGIVNAFGSPTARPLSLPVARFLFANAKATWGFLDKWSTDRLDAAITTETG